MSILAWCAIAYVALMLLAWRFFYVCAQGDADRNPIQDFADRDGVAADVFPLHTHSTTQSES